MGVSEIQIKTNLNQVQPPTSKRTVEVAQMHSKLNSNLPSTYRSDRYTSTPLEAFKQTTKDGLPSV